MDPDPAGCPAGPPAWAAGVGPALCRTGEAYRAGVRSSPEGGASRGRSPRSAMPSARRQLEAEHLRVERQLGVQRSADVRRLPEPVLLPLEGHVGHRHTLVAQRGDDHLRLVGRHHLVLEPLQDDQRPVEAVEVVDRRPLDVDVAPLGVRADQPVEVAALELVGLSGQRLEVGHPEVARRRRRTCRRRASATSIGEPARGAAPDAQPRRVDPALLAQPPGRRLAVLDVDDPPLRRGAGCGTRGRSRWSRRSSRPPRRSPGWSSTACPAKRRARRCAVGPPWIITSERRQLAAGPDVTSGFVGG